MPEDSGEADAEMGFSRTLDYVLLLQRQRATGNFHLLHWLLASIGSVALASCSTAIEIATCCGGW